MLDVYIPRDRRAALIEGRSLHDRTSGAVLFADMSGFTKKTEELADQLGPQRGAEAMRAQVDAALSGVIDEAHRYGGSVIGFAGDAVTCWFDGDDGRRATAAALAAQRRQEESGAPAMKFAVTAGLARRFLVGHPRVQRIDVLAGGILDRMADAEKLAHPGEVLVGSEVVGRIQKRISVAEWRNREGEGAEDTDESFAVVTGRPEDVATRPEPTALQPVPKDVARDYLLPPVHQRLERGRGELVTEMRRAVTLFAQFGGIDYDLDNDAEDKLDAYVKWVQTVLARYETFLISLVVGDKGSYFLATFGAPLAHEDDVTRALRAAEDLLDPPNEFDFVGDISIGISEGRMLAGTYGGADRRTYGVLGLAANVSARLMERARPGQILVTGSIADSAASQYEFHRLSGDPIPDTAGAVVFSVGVRRGEQQVVAPKSRVRTEIVGRATERASFGARLQALLDGESGVSVIEGPAGIGKSRLLVDFIEQARDLGLPTFSGAASELERNTPLFAWRTVFRSLLNLSDRADEAAVSEAVHGLLADSPELLERAPLLNPVLPVDLPDTETTARIPADVRADNAIEVMLACLQQPVGALAVKVLLFDDTQWLDSASWGLIEAARRRVPSLLIALTRRPVDSADAAAGLSKIPPGLRHDLDAHEGEVLRLEPLGDEEVVELIELHLKVPKVPHELRQLIVARSEGNPFFAQELVDSMLQRGAVTVDDFSLTVHGGLDQIDAEFPERIERLLVSRLDHLPLADQTTLVVGSVLGRTFPRRMLADVGASETTDDELTSSLANLIDLGLLEEALPGPDPTYQFHHGLTQRAAADLLPPARRSDLHARAAAWIEAHFDQSLAGWYPVLAQHWDAAGDVPKTLFYLDRAASQASVLAAYDEAIAFYSRALELASSETDGQSVARWHLRLGEVYVHRQREDTTEGRRHLETGLAELGLAPPGRRIRPLFGTIWQLIVQVRNRVFGPRLARSEQRREELRDASRAYERLVELYFIAGEPVLSLYSALRTVNLAEGSGPSPEWTRGMASVGALFGFVRLHGIAERYLDRSLASVEPDEPSAAAWASLAAGFYFTGLGDWERGEEQLNRVKEISEQVGEVRRAEDSLQSLTVSSYLRGELQAGLRRADDLCERAARRGADRQLAYGLAGRAYCLLGFGQVEEALDTIRRLEDLQDSDPLFPDQALIDDRYGLRALAELQAGRLRKAVQSADQVLARASGPPGNYTALAAFGAPAEVYLSAWRDQGKADRALRSKTRRALKLAKRYAGVFPVGKPRLLRWKGVRDLLRGKQRRAIRILNTSVDEARGKGMRLEEALGLVELANALGDEHPDSARHRSAAEQIFVELGADQEAERRAA